MLLEPPREVSGVGIAAGRCDISEREFGCRNQPRRVPNAYVGRECAPCSIVDVSARERAFGVHGLGAAALLNAGCPADLDNMPARSAARTVFDGAQIILIKWSADRFEVLVWRSFADHVLAVLEAALALPRQASVQLRSSGKPPMPKST